MSSHELFDIVILVGPNDKTIIKKQIEYTKKNIIGYRKIYIVSNYLDFENIDNCIIISESVYDFSIKDVIKYHDDNPRNNWYLQQLFKLYAAFYIPDILERYLVIDCDTFFLKPTKFIENNKCLYNTGTEFNKPYFDHMVKLHPSLIKIYHKKSGISHHMIFEKKYIVELFNLIESYHNKKFLQVFLENVIECHYLGAGASEYEIYFNYMANFHSENIIIRNLNWTNTSNIALLSSEYDYISWHWYQRN